MAGVGGLPPGSIATERRCFSRKCFFMLLGVCLRQFMPLVFAEAKLHLTATQTVFDCELRDFDRSKIKTHSVTLPKFAPVLF